MDKDPHDTITASRPIDFLVWQYETCPNTLRPHCQGYVVFTNRIRFAGLKKIEKTTHWEYRSGNHREAMEYCLQEEKRIPDTDIFMVGEEPVEQGTRTDLLNIKTMVMQGKKEKDIAQEYFTTWTRNYRAIREFIKMMNYKEREWMPTVICYWGPTGTGKSRKAHEDNKGAYRKSSGNKWWDGYDNHECVILDDFRGTWFPLDYLLQLLDRYPMIVESKGGFVSFLPKKIVITSNVDPKDWYNHLEGWDNCPLKRRFTEITEIKEPINF
jgi:hypothetical protein